MENLYGDWKLTAHELPDYEYLRGRHKDLWWEEGCEYPDGAYEYYPGGAEVVGGLIKIVQDDLYGFRDRYGNEAVPCCYDYAGRFDDGLCVVGECGYYGLVDADGREVLRPRYASLTRDLDFLNAGLVFVAPGKFFVEVSGAAEEIDVPRHPYANDGPRCLLEVEELRDFLPDAFWRPSDRLMIGSGGRYGIIDRRGRLCAPLVYDDIRLNGIARRDGRWALLDENGREVLPPVYDRLRKMNNRRQISGGRRGDLVIAEEDGRNDRLYTKNGLLLCELPARCHHPRDIFDHLMKTCLVGRLTETLCVLRAEGKYGLVQEDGRNDFEQDGQRRSGFAEILPFIWDDPKDCLAEHQRMSAESLAEKKSPEAAEADEPLSLLADHLAGPFVRRPAGVQNFETGEIVFPTDRGLIIPADGINSDGYFGFTARRDGRWHFVELIRQ